MEYFARNDSKIVLHKSICEVAATSMVSSCCLSGQGGGVRGGPGHVSMAKWARFCICNRQEMPGIARIKAGSCEVYAFRGLSRVGTTPIRSRGPVAGIYS